MKNRRKLTGKVESRISRISNKPHRVLVYPVLDHVIDSGDEILVLSHAQGGEHQSGWDKHNCAPRNHQKSNQSTFESEIAMEG